MSALDKFRTKPKTSIENSVDEDENCALTEEDSGEERPKTYKIKWQCTNCKGDNEAEIEWGICLEDTDVECEHCGCY